MGEYTKCKVDPSTPKFVDEFKQLHPDFQQDLELAKVSESSLFTYIVLTYDIYSPYVQKYKDWALRRNETAKASKFKVDNGRYIQEAEDIISGKNANTNRMIVRYLFLQNDLEFAKFHGYQSLYFKALTDAMNPSNRKPSESAKLRDNIDSLSTEIKMLQKSIFYGNETKDLLEALYDFAANITYDFKPEDIAERKENNKEVVAEYPYGKGYKKPKKLKFLDDN